MQLKRGSSVTSLLIILLSCVIFICDVYAISTGGEFFSELTPVEPGSQVFNPSELTPTNPTNNIFSPGDGVSSIPSVGQGASVQAGSGLLSDIVGSYNLIMKSGQIVGGVIVSSKNNNVIPALNLVDGSLVFYNMQLGDKVVIDQIGGDGIMGDEYEAKMDKGVSANVNKDLGKIRFTAYGDDSVLIIGKSEDPPKYEFKNGLLEYENKNVLEQINTTELDDSTVDKAYETGFRCLTLAPKANYNYQDKEDKEKSFSIKNDNNKDYTVCTKKTAYDEYSLESNLYSSLVDIMNDNFLLKAGVTFFKQASPVYKGFDAKNLARIESDVETTKLSLENRAPRTKLLSEVYTGIYKITETMVKGIVHRGFDYIEDRKPLMVNLYTSNMSKNYGYGDIKVSKDGILRYYSQDGEEKIVMHDPESAATKKCRELLKEILTYEQSIETEMEYSEKC